MRVLVKKIIFPDIKIEIGEVTLLSSDEYKCNEKIIPRIKDWWWLRTPGFCQRHATRVDPDGFLDSGNIRNISVLVRPALKIKSSSLVPEDKIKTAGHIWTVLHDGIVLCDDSVGRSSFRRDYQAEDANNYEASDVKKFLEKWAVGNGLMEKAVK